MNKVLFYVPNLIDYLRLVLIVVSWIYIDNPYLFLSCYVSQIFLDLFDGYFARTLNQVSSFGAWLDVVLDNLGRGLLWTHLFKYGYVVSSVEWICFAFTQRYGATWKDWFNQTPFIVKHVFKNNFRTITGFTAIGAGLQGLPVWLYIMRYFELNHSIPAQLLLFYCIIGRLLCLTVELWVIKNSIREMLLNDSKSNK